MQNFTGSWARAAGQPMPGAVNPMTSGNPAGTGAGPTVGSLRPKPNPQAGLNEAPAKSPWISGMMSAFMNQMMGIKTPKKKPAAPAPAAGLQDPAAAAARADRASRLMSIGAGLMD